MPACRLCDKPAKNLPKVGIEPLPGSGAEIPVGAELPTCGLVTYLRLR